jgi:predicted nucleic acid-binding protein
VILADTSAWVEYLRATGSPANIALRGLLDDKLAITGPVAMELLAGARDDHHLGRLRTVRSLIDCLIAAVAIRARLPILHSDNDYDVIARHTSLRVYQPA